MQHPWLHQNSSVNLPNAPCGCTLNNIEMTGRNRGNNPRLQILPMTRLLILLAVWFKSHSFLPWFSRPLSPYTSTVLLKLLIMWACNSLREYDSHAKCLVNHTSFILWSAEDPTHSPTYARQALHSFTTPPSQPTLYLPNRYFQSKE